jgi:hypothetical protein
MLRFYLSRLLAWCLREARRRETDATAINRLRSAEALGLDAPQYDSDLYDEAYDERVWHSYLNAIQIEGPEKSEIAFRAHKVRDAILGLNTTGVLINFGSGYGWLEHQIAVKSRLDVIGIDRRQAERNRRAFQAPNLRFEDVMDALAFIRAERPTVFSGVNILHIFTQGFVHKLFSTLAESDCQHVVIWEPSGISAETGRVYRYTSTPKRSEVYYGQTGGAVILHNYPALLAKAGFAVAYQSHHPWPDRPRHAPVMIIAARKSQASEAAPEASASSRHPVKV